MLSLRNVERRYRSGRGEAYVLRQVTLDVTAGEFVTVMGPSGAGKSTLLAILGMLDGDFGGEYRFLDHDVHGLAPKARVRLGREHIGFVFQQFHLLDSLTVYENLDVPLSYRDVKRSERAARVAELLDQFRIVGKKDLYPSQLSGGQQQLVAVARAIVARPRLILADEPTGNLHSRQGEEIMELFRALNEDGTTIVQVTHSDRNAAYGRRIVELHDGWVEADRAVGQLKS